MDEVVLVDAQDQAIGVCEKLRAHQEGLLHRAFSVVLYRTLYDQGRKQIELLLQKRAAQKYHGAGLWSNTCCSHPKPGEAVLDAAHRRLFEELGISGIDLKPIGAFVYQAQFDNGLIEHEYDHVLLGEYDGERVDLDPAEISEVKWVRLDILWDAVSCEKTKNQYTVWLPEVLNQIQGERQYV